MTFKSVQVKLELPSFTYLEQEFESSIRTIFSCQNHKELESTDGAVTKIWFLIEPVIGLYPSTVAFTIEDLPASDGKMLIELPGQQICQVYTKELGIDILKQALTGYRDIVFSQSIDDQLSELLDTWTQLRTEPSNVTQEIISNI